MAQDTTRVVTEFRCHYCGLWFETAQTSIHFAAVHDQEDVTFASLQERLACLGGLDVRERVPESEDDETAKPRTAKSWLLDDDADAEFFDTNNFRHLR